MNLLLTVAAGTFLALAGIEVFDRSISETRGANEEMLDADVPESSTLALAGLGLAGIAAIRRRTGAVQLRCERDTEIKLSDN